MIQLPYHNRHTTLATAVTAVNPNGTAALPAVQLFMEPNDRHQLLLLAECYMTAAECTELQTRLSVKSGPVLIPAGLVNRIYLALFHRLRATNTQPHDQRKTLEFCIELARNSGVAFTK